MKHLLALLFTLPLYAEGSYRDPFEKFNQSSINEHYSYWRGHCEKAVIYANKFYLTDSGDVFNTPWLWINYPGSLRNGQGQAISPEKLNDRKDYCATIYIKAVHGLDWESGLSIIKPEPVKVSHNHLTSLCHVLGHKI